MAREEREDRERRADASPPEFDAESLVDDMLALTEWMRDRRDSRCPQS